MSQPPKDMVEVEEKCNVCMKEASQRCAGCHMVYYCNKDHQKKDWKKHKGNCKPYKIFENEILGRHLVACRDIKKGEIVIREKPLIRGPSQITGPVCLGCLQSLAADTSEECVECGWPVCIRSQCYTSPDHKPECNWAKEKRKSKVRISQFISPHPSYECITPLRICYQKEANPVLWKKLNELESHSDARSNSMKQIADTKSIAEFLHRFYNIDKDFSVDEILRICGLLEVNGHEVPTTEPAHVAIYSTASMLEHNCCSNCSKSFSSDGDIIIHAAVPIKRGDHLSICYTDALWSTSTRKQHLLETKYFHCCCKRCSDVTEFNTYFSAVKCLGLDCDGLVLPPSFCTGGTVDWNCNKCGRHRPWLEIKKMLDKVAFEIQEINRDDPKECKMFLEKWSSTLSKRHFYLTEIALSLAQQYGQINGINNLSDDDLHYKIQLCLEMSDLIDTLAPAECRIRGVLAYELHASTAEIVRRSSGLTHGEVVQLLTESKTYLMKCISCLFREPELMPEGKLLIEAKNSLLQLENVLKTLDQTANQIMSL